MSGNRVEWAHDNVFNPAMAVRQGKLCLLFRAEDASGQGIGAHTSRIGFAESHDGIHFVCRRQPVLFPNKDGQEAVDWPGGCEDPRVVKGPDGYVMTYTSWNKKTARLCVATSPNLVDWTKRGPAFGKAERGRWRELWSKSGAVVTRRIGSSLVATRIGGRYWMYFGDTDVFLATSTNLVDWTPRTDSHGKLEPAMRPRHGRFDSMLCESGPPALLTRGGIVLLYNGANAEKDGDATLPPRAYSAGQALFSSTNPQRLLDRTDRPFFKPELAFERTGQYAAGTVFIEGLAWFHAHWLLAYGAADSRVGLASTR